MEYKYLNNPQIRKFLLQYDRSEWDAIIGDLLLYSINKIKEIEKSEEFPKKKEETPIRIDDMKSCGKIVFNNNNNSSPYEFAVNYLKKNYEYESNFSWKTKTLKKLDNLNMQINNIQSRDKNKISKRNNY